MKTAQLISEPSDLNQAISSIHEAIDKYYHPGMDAEELKTIITNVAIKSLAKSEQSEESLMLRAMVV